MSCLKIHELIWLFLPFLVVSIWVSWNMNSNCFLKWHQSISLIQIIINMLLIIGKEMKTASWPPISWLKIIKLAFILKIILDNICTILFIKNEAIVLLFKLLNGWSARKGKDLWNLIPTKILQSSSVTWLFTLRCNHHIRHQQLTYINLCWLFILDIVNVR